MNSSMWLGKKKFLSKLKKARSSRGLFWLQINAYEEYICYNERQSVHASLSRLVFKAAIFRAATAKLQGRDRLLFALKAIRDGLRPKPSACLDSPHGIP